MTFLVLLAAFWITCVGPIVVRERLRGYDVFRDCAAVVNIQHGRLFADPSYRDEQAWYPPLSPLMVAGLASALDVSPADCYRWSQLVFNWMLPAGLFLIMRLQWGGRAAMAGVVAFLLAMPWWQMEVAHGQPSIHAVVLGWAALLLYARQEHGRSFIWALCCGLFQGLSFWHHPFVPATLAVVFVLQALWAKRQCRSQLGQPIDVDKSLARNLFTIAVTLLIAAPILYLMLHGPVLNPEPREYLARELRTVEFALMGANPWIWGMGAWGLVRAIRRADLGSRLLVCAVAVCALAQLPGYARVFELGWAAHLPTVVPHEFQRLFQLAWAICMGVGIDAAISFVSARLRLPRAHRWATAMVTLLALTITGAWGLRDVHDNLRRYLLATSIAPQFQEAAEWIRHNTDINDVFVCEPRLAFIWLNAETGRKVWITQRGHSNPRVDWAHRRQVLTELLKTPSPKAFHTVALQNGIDYCIPSPGWSPRILSDPELFRAAVPAYLTLVGSPETVPIFKIVKR